MCFYIFKTFSTVFHNARNVHQQCHEQKRYFILSLLRLFIDFEDRFSFNDSQFGRYTPGTIRSFKTVRTRNIILDLIVVKLKITSTKTFVYGQGTTL